MSSDDAAPPQMGIFVALEVLVQPGEEGPRMTDTAARALERLAWVGRPVILATSSVAGRRLPTNDDERVAWTQHALGDGVEVVTFDPPSGGRHADDAEAVDRWRHLRDVHQARWLIEAGWPIAPARRAGITVIEVGGNARPVTERADHDARDLLDATNQLLMTETFRPAASS
jgi:hypothetical protein